jgi:hypothetical protein
VKEIDVIREALDSAENVIDKRVFRQTAVRIADARAALDKLEACAVCGAAEGEPCPQVCARESACA